jgi:MFS family permease
MDTEKSMNDRNQNSEPQTDSEPECEPAGDQNGQNGKNAKEQEPSPDTCEQSLRGLDALNFLMADTQTGVGPYLSIFLKSVRHYDPARIGMVMGAGSLAQVLLQTPAGAFIDHTRYKRLLVAIAAGLVGVGALMFIFLPQLWAVILAQVLLAGSGAVFGPAIAALSLGIAGHKYLTQRQSRNEAFNHTGNVASALLYGFIGFKVAQQGIFWCVGVFSIATVLSIKLIHEKDIDHQRASGGEENPANEPNPGQEHRSRAANEDGKPKGFLALWTDKRLLIFAATVILFHSANAAMLPLVGEVLGGDRSRTATLYMSAIIIISQMTMIPVAITVGKLGQKVGRKPIFLVGIASVAVRGVLFAIFKNPYALVATQVLDGIGAGIFGVLNVLITADLTRGTGRFNYAQGAIATSTGIGASLSNAGTGLLVKHSSFAVGFLTLAGVAVGAFVFAWFLLPETRDLRESEPNKDEPDKKAGTDIYVRCDLSL